MRHTLNIAVLTSLFVFAASICHAQPLKADKPAPPAKKPVTTSPQLFSTLTLSGIAQAKPTATSEKLKALGEHLARALDITVDLLSGNKAALFSGNRTNLLSGNAPKILSENQTPIFSGNKFSLFSNIKVEIRVENSGNGAGMPAGIRATAPTVVRPRVSQMIEPPSSEKFAPPSIPSEKP